MAIKLSSFYREEGKKTQHAYDLCLVPENKTDLLDMITLAKHVGFDGISLALERILKGLFPADMKVSEDTKQVVQKTLKDVAAVFSKLGKKLDMVITARITTSWRDPLRELFTFQNPPRNVIVAYKGETEEEIHRALKYWPPYLVSISFSNVRLLSKEVFNLSRQFYKPIEITLREFILASPSQRGHMLDDLRRTLPIINKRHLKLLFSSGARDPLEMRSIRAMRSLLETMQVKKRKILRTYKEAAEFVDQPRPAVLLDEENERDRSLLETLDSIGHEATESC